MVQHLFKSKLNFFANHASPGSVDTPVMDSNEYFQTVYHHQYSPYCYPLKASICNFSALKIAKITVSAILDMDYRNNNYLK